MRIARSLVVQTLALALLAAAPPAAAGTLDTVREQGVLRLGFRADARPFSYKDESGQPAGYSIALCQKIADAVSSELGLARLELAYREVTSEGAFDAVDQGEIDLFCGAATATLERRKRVAFSIGIFPSGIGALMRADASEALKARLEEREPPYQPRWRGRPSDVLQKRVVSTLEGTTAESALIQRIQEMRLDSAVVTVPSYEAGVAKVLARESDALFGDRPILLDAAARSPSSKDLIVLARQFSYEPIALAYPRGDADFGLIVDRTLSRLYRSREIDPIYERAFGKPDQHAQIFFGIVALPE